MTDNQDMSGTAGEIAHLSIAQASVAIASMQLSPVQLTEVYLRRIEQFDGKLHSFLCVTADQAIVKARVAEDEIAAGRYRGPLHGIPFGVKDVYETAGIPTTGNSPAFQSHVPKTDATVVRLLQEAGAILIGKQATHELTYGGVSLDLPWVPPANPWNPEHDTGGSSSGGGAAVAAGLCMMAMGTDTGGSIRNPAAYCGVVGLKPTYGLVSRVGVMPNSYSLDHCGPLTRTVRDCSLVLDAIAKHDPSDPASSSFSARPTTSLLDGDVRSLRIGHLAHLYERDMPASQEVRTAMAEALKLLKDQGAQIGTVSIEPLQTYATCKATIQLPEVYAAYRQGLEGSPDKFGAKFRARVLPAAQIAAIDYVAALAERRRLTAAMARTFESFDVLITSGPYAPPPRIVDASANWEFNKAEITVPFSVTGFPAISICNGFTGTGFPLSMQIVGRPFDEGTVLRVAHAYELATPWHKRRPNLEGLL
jgi:aspartyl-tRNA(Asn)/glutamyl-tRNA(Gln) amidotransferase subunit A